MLTGGEDFGADPITLSFTANVTSVVANIPIINDAIVEDSETFQFFTEAGSSELTIDVSQAMGSLMILDNEGEPCHFVYMQMKAGDMSHAGCVTAGFVIHYCMLQNIHLLHVVQLSLHV